MVDRTVRTWIVECALLVCACGPTYVEAKGADKGQLASEPVGLRNERSALELREGDRELGGAELRAGESRLAELLREPREEAKEPVAVASSVSAGVCAKEVDGDRAKDPKCWHCPR